ncbi:MAG: hypothetical protein IT247_03410 [Bacteroidia bacterium]|nr:hypothetical protein [Bacteroidia bacterium]
MKKVFSVLALASALAFVACGGEKKTEEAPATEAPANADSLMNATEEAPAADSTAAAPADSAAATAAPAEAAPDAH